MRAVLLGAALMLLSASPAAASEVDSFMAPIESYQKYTMAQAEDPGSEFNQRLVMAESQIEQCAVRSLGGKKFKKRLKSKQGKVLQNYLVGVVTTDMLSQSYTVFGPKLLEVADQLEALPAGELSEVARAGAEYNRLSVEFFKEKDGGSFACRFFKKAAALKSWTRKKLERTYLASFPTSPSRRQELTRKLDASQNVLRDGAQKLEAMGASESQLEAYVQFFTLSE